MKKLTIKDVINFRGKSDRSRKIFAHNLKLYNEKEKEETKGGGNYWTCCTSAIGNSYKLENIQFISDKIDELEEKYNQTEYLTTKLMYERNLIILRSFQDFDLERLRPSENLKILQQHKWNQVLTIKGLQIKITPNYVFSFENNDVKEVGAIWFIAQLNGFKKDELGMFAEVIYEYLKKHYSKSYNVNPEYCIAVDVFKCIDVNYLQIREGVVPKILSSILDEIKKLV